VTYIIGEACIDVKDISCQSVCPVDCIHEMDRMLVIDPEECIDCGACEPECPVEAIFPEDALTEKALIDGVIDVRWGEPAEVVTEPQALMAVKDALEGVGVRVRSAQLAMEATQTAHPPDGEAEKVLTFLDALEEHEDVQRVFSNAEFDEAQLEALA